MERSRRLVSAELLSVGTELTVGETRDTNSSELARSLTELGLTVGRIQAVPDVAPAVVDAFRAALDQADLVVSTGGLGPTPDDLTREAIAAVVGETPAVDPDLEAWLRGLWARRDMPMPDMNLKQAWLVPSAVALPNGNGTAPGWWVDRPDGRVIVALPGPPREMRSIWSGTVVARLRERGAGVAGARRTFRLAGIGESVVAERLGEELLRASRPEVATYARWDAIDVRVSASGDGAAGLVDATSGRILDLLGEHVWAEGDTTWPEAIGRALADRGWTLSTVEIGTAGALAALLAGETRLRLAESLDPTAPAAREHAVGAGGLELLTRRAVEVGGSEVGLGVRIRPRGDDTAVSVVVVTPTGVHRERRLVFLGGEMGRSRAALAAAHVLLTELGRSSGATS